MMTAPSIGAQNHPHKSATSYLRLARYAPRANRSLSVIRPSKAGIRELGFCDFGFFTCCASHCGVCEGSAPTWLRSGAFPPPEWHRAQPLASNTALPDAMRVGSLAADGAAPPCG